MKHKSSAQKRAKAVSKIAMQSTGQATADEVAEAFCPMHDPTLDAHWLDDMFDYYGAVDEEDPAARDAIPKESPSTDAEVAPHNVSIGNGHVDCLRLGIWRKLEVALHQPRTCREVPYVRFDHQRKLYIASIMGVRDMVKRNRQRGPQMVVIEIFKSHELREAIAARDAGLSALGVEMHVRKGERGVWWTLARRGV